MGGKKQKPKLAVTAGEVYAGLLPDGRYGAVHVIEVMKDGHRRGRDSALLAVTSYVGSELPKIDDPLLRRPLKQSRGFYKNGYSVSWTEESPPADYLLVGSFPPSKEETNIKSRGSYGAHWSLANAFYEWRWENDRDAFQREIEEVREDTKDGAPITATGPRSKTKGAKLDIAQFWQFMASLDPDADDGEVYVNALIKRLGRRSRADIIEFGEQLAELLYTLDRREFAKNAGDAGGSSDSFLYARCYVLSRGRQYFERVLADPTLFPKDVDFEELLSVCEEAFEESTGESFEHVTHFSYETAANEEGWSETTENLS